MIVIIAKSNGRNIVYAIENGMAVKYTPKTRMYGELVELTKHNDSLMWLPLTDYIPHLERAHIDGNTYIYKTDSDQYVIKWSDSKCVFNKT